MTADFKLLCELQTKLQLRFTSFAFLRFFQTIFLFTNWLYKRLDRQVYLMLTKQGSFDQRTKLYLLLSNLSNHIRHLKCLQHWTYLSKFPCAWSILCNVQSRFTYVKNSIMVYKIRDKSWTQTLDGVYTELSCVNSRQFQVISHLRRNKKQTTVINIRKYRRMLLACNLTLKTSS